MKNPIKIGKIQEHKQSSPDQPPKTKRQIKKYTLQAPTPISDSKGDYPL